MGTGERRSAPRNRPVSCYFCRSRKLRCSRQAPCSNCLSRGISCTLQSFAAPNPSERSHITSSTQAPARPTSDSASNSELLARVRLLEEVVLQQTEDTRHGRPRKRSPPAQPIQRRTTVSPNYGAASSEIEADVLKNASINEGLLTLLGPIRVTFRVCSIKYISESPLYIWPSGARQQVVVEPVRCIWIPRHEEAKLMFEKYARDITYIHHVIHIPTVRAMVDQIYNKLAKDEPVDPPQIALLLSIFASTTYSWTFLDLTAHPGLFESVEEANAQSPLWVKGCLDLVDRAGRCASRSVENIQAMIIAFFMLINFEGITLRYTSLLNQAISMARDLGFHRLDHSHPIANTARPTPGTVAEEIGRRIWWYLSATDWMSRYASPHEGIYTIIPRQTTTRKPLNANDDDLFDGMPNNINKPLSEPTEMSYFLQRIRLGELCRELCDRMPVDAMPGEPASHAQVLEVDAKFNEFMAGIPVFFRLSSSENSPEDIPGGRKLTPGIIIQRYILNSLLHSHRCKMHLPYITGKYANSASYAYSRKTCLDAARQIIRTERLLEREALAFVHTRFRISGVLQSVFIANIAFLLDLCFHSDHGEYDPTRKAELLDACSILEDAWNQSPMISGLIESLNSVARKYKLPLPFMANIDRSSAANPSTLSTAMSGLGFTPSHVADGNAPSSTNITAAANNDHSSVPRPAQVNLDMPFFDWESFSSEMEVDSLDWNALLNELDSQYFASSMPSAR